MGAAPSAKPTGRCNQYGPSSSPLCAQAKPSGFCLISSVDEADQGHAAGLNQPPIDGVERDPIHLADHPRAVLVDGLHVSDGTVTTLPRDYSPPPPPVPPR